MPPFTIGVIRTAKVLPEFNAPALDGSNDIPDPSKVVPVIFVEVLLVFHPLGIAEPAGQSPVVVSL